MTSLEDRSLEEETIRFRDEVMQDFSKFGVPLKYKPRIGLVSLVDETIPDQVTYAQARIGDQVYLRNIEEINKAIGISYFRSMGLKVSDDAFSGGMQNLQRQLQKSKDSFWEFGDVDVVLYPPYTKLDPQKKKSIIAHELWHLLEDQEGVFQENPLIGEATATIVQKMFSPQEERGCYSPEYCDNLVDLPRIGGAYVLLNILKKCKGNWFKKMLSPDFRREVQAEYNRVVTPRLMQVAEDTVKRYPQFGSASLEPLKGYACFEGFNIFSKDPTHENLISAYECLGFTLLADQLRNQDTAKLRARLKECIK